MAFKIKFSGSMRLLIGGDFYSKKYSIYGNMLLFCSENDVDSENDNDLPPYREQDPYQPNAAASQNS